MKKVISIPFTILTVISCVCLVVDLFMEMRLISVFGMSLTPGIFIYPIMYIVNDCITEVYGFKKAMFVTLLAFVALLCTAFLMQLACWLPATGTWAGEEHFQYIFGMAPRITVASILGFVCGTASNAYIMDIMKVHNGEQKFKTRAFLSTCAGEPVDAFVFFTIAYAGLVPILEIITVAFWTSIGKILYEACVLPITHYVIRKIKDAEYAE